MWPWLLLLLPFGFAKKSASTPSSGTKLPASFDASSVVVRLVAGEVIGELYLRPRVGWYVSKAGSVVAQGTSSNTAEPARPLLEAFADASPGLAVTAYFSAADHVLTIAVYRLQSSDGERWGWTATDGVQVANGLEDSRGRALLAALDRAEAGPTGGELEEPSHG